MRRGVFFAAVSLFSLLIASQRVLVAGVVTATVGGQSVPLGNLNYSLSPSGDAFVNEATFQLNDAFKVLMNDWGQFRWFQIVTTDTDPINYQGKALKAVYVDPPNGGWDYQRDPAGDFTKGTPGADASPFYENDTGFAGNKNSYPNYDGNLKVFGGKAGTFPIADTSLGLIRTQDMPGLGGNNNKLIFETFLAYISKCMPPNTFQVLAGYTWGIQTDGMGKLSAIAPSDIKFSPDLVPNTNTVNISAALAGPGGFPGWSAVFDSEIQTCCAPEPATWLVIVLMGGYLGIWQRRRARGRVPRVERPSG
ncbi:MAG: hypothetical protein K2Y37_16965 [Pirellulales bacterium]|nr:hypothetical protein [Pirellulales bacterium]